ncbi:MAG: MurR/RpiR family transcriptional regulator [Acidimicrobiales bacterium]
MMDHDENATTGGLAGRLDRITSGAERRVAEYLVHAGSRAAPMSAQEIADAVGTSDATVVRTAKRLGYANLRELRRVLADDADETDLAARLRATIGDSPSAHDVLATAVDRHLEALNALLRRVSADDFDRATGVLAGAAHIWWCGTGPSAHLASYAAFLCRRLGTSSGALTHSGTDHADELLSLRADHVVVVLAYGRVHPYVRVLLQHAAEVGAHVVLITDAPGRRLTAPIAVQLNAGRGTPGRFATHGPTMVLLEALVLAVAAAEPGRSDSALATLNDLRRSLAGKRLDVDPD